MIKEKTVSMCKTNQGSLPAAGRFVRSLSTATTIFVLAVLCSLAPTRASAQACLNCPNNANDTAIANAFRVSVIRNGINVRVNGQHVGACEQIILEANVSYNPNGLNQGIGAGFTAGQGHYILFRRGNTFLNQEISNCTPSDMGTTLVTLVGDPQSCVPPAGTTATQIKNMVNGTYNLTAADIAAGFIQFEFEYTNGVALLTNNAGLCLDRVSATPQVNISIAPLPTCSIAPPNAVCVGQTATIGPATVTGTAPFTYCWKKGCPGAGNCLSTSDTL